MLILQPAYLILYEKENLIKYAKKASAQNRAKALKFIRFLDLVAMWKSNEILEATRYWCV